MWSSLWSPSYSKEKPQPTYPSVNPVKKIDYVYHVFIIPFIVLIATLEILGVVIYLRSNLKLVKYLSLILTICLIVLIPIVVSDYYWANYV